jgi:DNA-directed RNA polymerase subunit RPC12/RpoP
MRDTLLVLGIACLIFGFVAHDLWYVAVPALIMSLAMSPSGRRPDGLKRLPGPFGWILDEIVISIKMKDCPHCGHKIMKNEKVCLFCKKEVEESDEGHGEHDESEELLSDENEHNEDNEEK